MSGGRVLIIEDDEWVVTLLAKFLRDAGYEVHTAGQAREGFELAHALEPDCIICDVVLPDIDGFWVARRVRTAPSHLATTPFLFLTQQDDNTDARLQGLNVGADVYISSPFRHEEVVAQVGALIGMANRLREKRDSFIEGPSSGVMPAFHGDLAQMSLATMLTMLELERRTGELKVSSEAGEVRFELVEGGLVRVHREQRPVDAIEALRESLHWKRGHFWFRPTEAQMPPEQRRKLGALLLEAMRVEDESAR